MFTHKSWLLLAWFVFLVLLGGYKPPLFVHSLILVAICRLPRVSGLAAAEVGTDAFSLLLKNGCCVKVSS